MDEFFSERAYFRAFGFVVLPGALDANEAAALAAEADQAIRDATGHRYLVDDDRGGITGHYIPATSERTPLSMTLMLRYAPLVEHLTGAPMLPVLTQYALFFDMAGWHTDTGHAVPSVKVAAYLEPLDADHGALRVLPGSHALDERVLLDLMRGPAFRDPTRYREATRHLPAHVITSEPGDVIMFDEHLWHASIGGRNRHQWSSTYVLDPATPEEDQAVTDYLASQFSDGKGLDYDPVRYPTMAGRSAPVAPHGGSPSLIASAHSPRPTRSSIPADAQHLTQLYSFASQKRRQGVCRMTNSDVSGREPPPGIDTRVTHSARVWNYWLGGKDNYPVDRESGAQIQAYLPSIVDIARADRAFLAHAVRHLASEAGIRQFLDVGTGLPTASNTHEVAQAVAPACRIVYVDNDPMVLAHARALLTSTPEGVTDYIDADVRAPDVILTEAARTLDFTQPIALMLLGIMNHILDNDVAYAIVDRLLDALPSGSYLALTHPTADIDGDAVRRSMAWMNEHGRLPITARSHQEVTRFFAGLELLDPGVVSTSLWRPDPTPVGTPREVAQYCGVARKP